MSFEYIDRNAERIQNEIKTACNKAGRNDLPIVVAAVKYATPEEIDYLHKKVGITQMGENRVQQLLSHIESVDCDGIDFHFIGTLQTNKVKYIIDKVKMIHSLDSEKLAEEIDRQAKKRGLVMNVLVEVNSGAEESKSGVLPENVEDFCKSLTKYSNIKHVGFMTMAPKCDKKEDYLKYFAQTYEQVLDIWTKKLHNIDKPVISMGMSDSFNEAIMCGSDIVRIGRAFFEK